MAPKDAETKAALERRLARAAALLEKVRELQAQEWDCIDEARKILAGEASIGDRLRQLSDFFCAAWEERYKVKYAWAGVKDSTQAKRLLRDHEQADLEQRILAYMRDPDRYLRDARHPFALFAGRVNRYVPAVDELTLEAPAADCPHTPPCATDADCTRRKLRQLQARKVTE